MLPVDVLDSVPSSNDGFNQLLAKQILGTLVFERRDTPSGVGDINDRDEIMIRR